jgi:hypothetical protein
VYELNRLADPWMTGGGVVVVHARNFEAQVILVWDVD